MDRELDTRKVYIDSRFLSSGSTSKFLYDLGETIEIPRDHVAYVTEFTSVCVAGTL